MPHFVPEHFELRRLYKRGVRSRQDHRTDVPTPAFLTYEAPRHRRWCNVSRAIGAWLSSRWLYYQQSQRFPDHRDMPRPIERKSGSFHPRRFASINFESSPVPVRYGPTIRIVIDSLDIGVHPATRDACATASGKGQNLWELRRRLCVKIKPPKGIGQTDRHYRRFGIPRPTCQSY